MSESFSNYLEFEIKFSRVLPPKHSIVVNCLSIFRVFKRSQSDALQEKAFVHVDVHTHLLYNAYLSPFEL